MFVSSPFFPFFLFFLGGRGEGGKEGQVCLYYEASYKRNEGRNERNGRKEVHAEMPQGTIRAEVESSTGILSLSIGEDTAHSAVVHISSYYLYFLYSYTGLYYLVSLLQTCNTKKRDTCIPRDPCILAYLPHQLGINQSARPGDA